MHANTLNILMPNADSEWIASTLDGIGIPEDPRKALSLAARVAKVDTQKSMAVFAINVTGGKITAEDLTTVLTLECEGKVGERHGPHYLSLARTGKLAGVRELTIESKKKIATPFESMDEANKALEAVLRRLPESMRAEFSALALSKLS